MGIYTTTSRLHGPTFAAIMLSETSSTGRLATLFYRRCTAVSACHANATTPRFGFKQNDSRLPYLEPQARGYADWNHPSQPNHKTPPTTQRLRPIFSTFLNLIFWSLPAQQYTFQPTADLTSMPPPLRKSIRCHRGSTRTSHFQVERFK